LSFADRRTVSHPCVFVWELVIILVIVLLISGANRLPELGTARQGQSTF
jgi:hypothetical protein